MARKNFYNDSYINNDFHLIRGNDADLNNYLKQLYVTPYDLSKATTIYFKAAQLDLSTLNNNGLLKSETLGTGNLTQNGAKFNKSKDFHIEAYNSKDGCYQINSCISKLKCFESKTHTKCNKGFRFFNSNGTMDLRIPLKVMD